MKKNNSPLMGADELNTKSTKLGLCAGRHIIPDIEGYIFDKIEDVTDLRAMSKQVHASLRNIEALDLYVTGLTVALIAVINYCNFNLIPLTLWHFNSATGEYFPQEVNTTFWEVYLREGGYI
nr:MAG TPA: hypothetical protein [Caudoviricetes sp.]